MPKGVKGQTYVVLTDCDDYMADETFVSGLAIEEVTNKDAYDAFP